MTHTTHPLTESLHLNTQWVTVHGTEAELAGLRQEVIDMRYERDYGADFLTASARINSDEPVPAALKRLLDKYTTGA